MQLRQRYDNIKIQYKSIKSIADEIAKKGNDLKEEKSICLQLLMKGQEEYSKNTLESQMNLLEKKNEEWYQQFQDHIKLTQNLEEQITEIELGLDELERLQEDLRNESIS